MAASNCNRGATFVGWEDLPDPVDPATPSGHRTQIIVDSGAWRHLLEKHVLSCKEPWEDVFSLEVLDSLGRSDRRNDLGDEIVVQALLELEGQVRSSLGRPLALVYEVRPLGWSGAHPLQDWLLILPVGATVYVHSRQGGNWLATCYFSRAAVVEFRRERRWQSVVRRLVLR